MIIISLNRCKIGIAVVIVGRNILAKPRGRHEGIGRLGIGELNLHKHEAEVAAMEDVEFGNKSLISAISLLAAKTDAVASFGNTPHVALLQQVLVALGSEGKLFFAVVDGSRIGRAKILFDCENIGITHPADAQGG